MMNRAARELSDCLDYDDEGLERWLRDIANEIEVGETAAEVVRKLTADANQGKAQ
jgi:hypothetical protein